MSLCALETGLTFEEVVRRLILCCYEVKLVQQRLNHLDRSMQRVYFQLRPWH